MENTLDNLNEIGIIEIGAFSNEISTERQNSFGQVSGIYSGCPEGNDIYAIIKDQEEIAVGDGKYKLSLVNVTSFWVERYPTINFDGKIYELEAKKAEQEAAGEDTTKTEKELNRYIALRVAATNASTSAIKLSVNGTEVVVAPNRICNVHQGINSLTMLSVKYPIIINYVCSLTKERNDEVGEVESIDSSRIWG